MMTRGRRWEIVYEDGAVCTSDVYDYWEVPRYGVQAVLQESADVGVEVVISHDGWWIWKHGLWFGTNREGADAYRLHHISPEQTTLQGTWVRHDVWQDLLRLIEDRKSGWYPHERKRGDDS